jgi:drug/metabolite transporter (DMT)-like permease|tara:strand:+ start:1024 stop:1458 length:435 start_codon:yes stop_codon:yes gene_type:complete
MKIINSGLGFAIASMLFMGISTFLYKRSTDALGATNTTFFYYLFSIVIATGVWIMFREKEPFSPTALIWPFIIAICLFLSVWFFNLSLLNLQVSAASTIRALFFIVTVVLAVVFAKEQPGPLGMAGIGLAIIAVILIGIDQSKG